LSEQEGDVGQEALSTLRAIAVVVRHGTSNTEAPQALNVYLKPVLKECKEHFLEPQTKQAKAAARIFNHVGSSSPEAYSFLVRGSLPTLSTIYDDSETIAARRAVMEILLEMLKPAVTFYSKASSVSTTETNPFLPYEDRLFQITSQAMMGTSSEHASFRVVAGKCLQELCGLRDCLSEEEIGLAVQHFDEVLLDPRSSEKASELKDVAVRALLHISSKDPTPIFNITIPALLARLPDDSSSDDAGYREALEGLARLCSNRDVAQTVIRRLFGRLNASGSSSTDLDFGKSVLLTLSHIFRTLEQRGATAGFSSYFPRVVDLIGTCASALQKPATRTVLSDSICVEALGRLVCVIVRHCDDEKQEFVGREVYFLFRGDLLRTLEPWQIPSMLGTNLILSTNLLAGIDRKVATSPSVVKSEADLAPDAFASGWAGSLSSD